MHDEPSVADAVHALEPASCFLSTENIEQGIDVHNWGETIHVVRIDTDHNTRAETFTGRVLDDIPEIKHVVSSANHVMFHAITRALQQHFHCSAQRCDMFSIEPNAHTSHASICIGGGTNDTALHIVVSSDTGTTTRVVSARCRSRNEVGNRSFDEIKYDADTAVNRFAKLCCANGITSGTISMQIDGYKQCTPMCTFDRVDGPIATS